MRAVIASILFNLELPETFKRKKFYGISLEKEGNQIKSLNVEYVRSGAGSVQHDSFLNNPCFYINKEIISSTDRLIDLTNEMLSVRAVIQNTLIALWLVKDNAVNSDLIISKSQDDYVAFNRAPLMFSNANGEYQSTLFSVSEIKEGFDWFYLVFSNVLIGKELNVKELERTDDGTIFANSNKDIPYQNSNRLQRAMRFILLARSDSFLPAKITFYISALESLLSISNVELRMQVADKSARILGNNFEEKLEINKIVSIAYSFRSNYIHGAVNSDKTLKKTLRPYESAEDLSSEIDKVLRDLIKRFLTDLKHVVDMNDEDFSLWTKELLYK